MASTHPTTQYSCGNPERLQRLRGLPGIVGIDFVEVVDSVHFAPTWPAAARQSAAQHTLLVRGTRRWPSGWGVTNVAVRGGVRVVNPTVQRVLRLSEWGALPLADRAIFEPPERAWLTALFADTAPAMRREILIVRVARPGDFSEYTLSIASLPAGAGVALDLILSSVAFSFKASCPTAEDCAPDDACAQVDTTPSPQIDYLAKDYQSFRQLLLDRLAVTLPAFTESSPADLGNTLVELLAYTADYLSYQQDAVATEAYLQTARRRTSVRRHATLLDYPMHDGSVARTWVVIEATDGTVVPRGTRLLTRVPGIATVGVTAEELAARPTVRPVMFETLAELTVRANRTLFYPYTWGDDDCCLPMGATEMTVFAEEDAISVGDILVIEELVNPDTARAADRRRSWRHAVRVTAVSSTPSDPVFSTGPLATVTWHDDDALPFALRLGVTSGDGSAGNYGVRGNVVLADEGETVSNEALTVVPAGRYRPRLEEVGIGFAVPLDADPARAASSQLAVAPSEAIPAISLVDGEGHSWTARRSLLEIDADTRAFVVETEQDGVAWLRFGDGTLGRRPSEGTTFFATYRVSRGTAGNIGADALAMYLLPAGSTLTLDTVRNPLGATGGTDPEPLTDVKRFAPQAFRTQRRAVTEADYATLLAGHPDVQRAVARRRFTGSWTTMFVTIDRKGGAEVDDTFRAEILEYLDPFRMMGVDLEVRPPVSVGLDIALTVCLESGQDPGSVRAALSRTFSTGVLTDGTRGFFHPDNFTFGDPLYFSRIVSVAMALDGVHLVFTTDSPTTPTRLRRLGEPDRGELAAGVIRMGETEILRVDNDPDHAERGVIRFTLLGGT